MRLASTSGLVHVVNGPWSRHIGVTATACGKHPTSWSDTSRDVTCTVCRMWLSHYAEAS